MHRYARLACLTFSFVTPALFGAEEAPFDILIRGGRIVDGTGAPSYLGDVGVREGKIERIGSIGDAHAKQTIDAAGLVVAPGFVDLMGQTALPLLEDSGAALNLLTQGITTINAGEGESDAPLGEEGSKSQGWRTMAEYLQLLDLRGLPLNVVQTVGHTQVRKIVLGDVDRKPSEAELERMRGLVEEAMDAGAIGVSTALIYPPAVYADTREIASLVEVAGRHGGGYFTHMRNEGDRLIEAIDEAIEIGRSAHAPVHIFHLKTAGRANWGKMELAIARIRAARFEGLDVTADVYPYINNGLGIESFIHPKHFAEGRPRLLERLDDASFRAEVRAQMESESGWENWYRHVGNDWSKVVVGRTSHEKYKSLAGRSLAEIAKVSGEDPWDVFFQLVRSGAFALPESMTETNKILAMRQNFVAFSTDVGPAGGSDIASHPRAFGAFPRLLGRYVRELGAIPLERAVAQASAAAANQVFAYDRGRIAIGQAADIIVFDAEHIADKATFAEPSKVSEGIRDVIVNGVFVLEKGKQTQARPGRVLRGPGWRAASASASVATGDENPRMAPIDRAVRSFLAEHRVPGAAVAITEHGRLVYARGFGYADLAERKPVEPTSLFRIASISKPITAAAILQLVEEGKLGLDDKVFDVLHVEPHLEAGAQPDARQKDITIRQLLQHRGGWDRDASFDAMFQPVRFAKALGVAPPAGPTEIIRAMSGLPLDFEPGARYAYSNYGYCLLGRVIEKLTGQPYEESVRERLLRPLGIQRMRLGRSRRELRAEGEVCYYEPEWGPSCFADDLDRRVPEPYGAWHLEAMDAHGGWLASVVDLARFACAFDDPQACKVLKPASVQAIPECPPGRAGHDKDGHPLTRYYGLGWQVSVLEGGAQRWEHSGSLPGTATLLVRRPDGRNIVILLNTRSSARGVRPDTALEAAIAKAIPKVKKWPTSDLFFASSRAAAVVEVDRPAFAVGYTEYRTDLPGGMYPYFTSMRACVVEGDGSGRRVLAEELTKKEHAWTQFAGWSPDGRMAIIGSGWESPENAAWEEEHKTFRMTEGWLYDMCLLDLASNQLSNVTAVDRVSIYNTGLFYWPGDSRKLGFQALVGADSHPFSMDLDGRNKKDLTEGSREFAYGFSASPDGKLIAYHKSYQVYLAKADGSDAKRVETGNPFNFVPTWSPDGEWVLFVSGEHHDCHPHIVRRDGTGLRKLAERGGYRGTVECIDKPSFHSESSDVPVWSPDGKWIYFTAKVGESVELMRVALEGQPEQLTHSAPGVLHYHPHVSPDSRWVVFGSNKTGTRQLHAMRAEGGGESQLTHVASGEGAMWAWWRPVTGKSVRSD